MGQLKNFILALFAAILVTWAQIGLHAETDLVEFSNDNLRDRYLVLIKELRCPKCQNQNLADSNSMISVDLRNQIHELLEQGKTDEQIVEFMVERYGDFVRYRPALQPSTLVLWLLPAVVLMIILIFVVAMLRRQRKKSLDLLAEDEQKRLSELLNPSSTESK